jgi:hypothetical protein
MKTFKGSIEVEQLSENTNIPVSHATDAVSKVLGQKGAVNFLAKLKPGVQKHTSWNEINSALIDQGAQPAHIAKVAGHLKPTQYNEGKQMKTFREFKEDYQIEDLAHAEKRYAQANRIFQHRAGLAAKANPNTTRTTPEQHAALSDKAGKSYELRGKKIDKLQSAQAADRAANPLSQSEKDKIERNARGYGQNRNMGD